MKRKKIKSKTKLSEMYSKYGAGALRDRANKSGHKYWTFCDQCDSETPALRDMSCLMCGSTSDRGLRRNAGSKTNCDIITSTDWEDKENTLVYEKSLSPVCVGQKVRSRENYIVSGGRAPHKASSSGRVYVRTIGKGDPRLRMGREFFPHVFNMKWIPSYNLYPMDKVSGKARLKINRNSARSADMTVANELFLFIQNDEILLMRRYPQYVQNLERKIKRGVYNREKAVKLFMYLADEASKKYSKQFGDGKTHTADVPTRIALAKMLLERFEEDRKTMTRMTAGEQARAMGIPNMGVMADAVEELFIRGNLAGTPYGGRDEGMPMSQIYIEVAKKYGVSLAELKYAVKKREARPLLWKPLSKNSMINPDLSISERDQDSRSKDFSPLKKLVMDLASDFAPVVKDIESTRYSTTQNNYGRYMSLISSMSKGDKKRAEIIAMALITAGANRSGVKSALRVMFGE